MGHNYMGHSYIGPNCIGHNYMGHNYLADGLLLLLQAVVSPARHNYVGR